MSCDLTESGGAGWRLAGCIKEWFKSNRTCPVCRFEVEA